MEDSCTGEYACFDLANGAGSVVTSIVDSCRGDLACVLLASGGGSVTSIKDSCRGDYACYFLARNGGSVGAITGSCCEANSCRVHCDGGSQKTGFPACGQDLTNVGGCVSTTSNVFSTPFRLIGRFFFSNLTIHFIILLRPLLQTAAPSAAPSTAPTAAGCTTDDDCDDPDLPKCDCDCDGRRNLSLRKGHLTLLQEEESTSAVTEEAEYGPDVDFALHRRVKSSKSCIPANSGTCVPKSSKGLFNPP